VAGTILITGATDGLGRALAERAHRAGWTVLAHGRSQAKLDAVAAALPGTRTFRADLASLAETATLAEAVRRDTERLDVIVSNAGVGFGGAERELSADGLELRFAVNYLAGYLLVRTLLPLVRASAPARIVHVASAGQQAIDFDDVMLERGWDGNRAYWQSKLAQIMLTFDLAEELDPAQVTATALHPGTYMPTKLVIDAGIAPLTPLDHGVDATWRLATDPAMAGVTGRYFDGTREKRPEGQALDSDARRALRELSERLTGV